MLVQFSVLSFCLPMFIYRGGYSPPTSEVGGSNPGPCVGKLDFAFVWSAVYSTES